MGVGTSLWDSENKISPDVKTVNNITQPLPKWFLNPFVIKLWWFSGKLRTLLIFLSIYHTFLNSNVILQCYITKTNNNVLQKPLNINSLRFLSLSMCQIVFKNLASVGSVYSWFIELVPVKSFFCILWRQQLHSYPWLHCCLRASELNECKMLIFCWAPWAGQRYSINSLICHSLQCVLCAGNDLNGRTGVFATWVCGFAIRCWLYWSRVCEWTYQFSNYQCQQSLTYDFFCF